MWLSTSSCPSGATHSRVFGLKATIPVPNIDLQPPARAPFSMLAAPPAISAPASARAMRIGAKPSARKQPTARISPSLGGSRRRRIYHREALPARPQPPSAHGADGLSAGGPSVTRGHHRDRLSQARREQLDVL